MQCSGFLASVDSGFAMAAVNVVDPRRAID